ncbi:MAG: hypothetical protein GX196_05725 [Clostridiaceae bacterium]|nr:hypothetical protein [Clostridiaceae bacterium]
MAKKGAKKEFFTYKGKPLFRKGNQIYYGNPTDKYIILFTLSDQQVVNGLSVANKVVIELMTNTGKEKEKVIKKAEREGLYQALDIAEFWLEDALMGN